MSALYSFWLHDDDLCHPRWVITETCISDEHAKQRAEQAWRQFSPCGWLRAIEVRGSKGGAPIYELKR